MDEAMKQIGMDAVDNFLLRFGQLNSCGALMGKVSREMRAGITALKAQRREAQPAPADVVGRMIRAFDEQGEPGTCDVRASMTAALAVAREEYVPASELEKAQEMGIVMSSQIGRYQLRIAELEQQLATMYTKEQVLPDQEDNYDELYALRSEVVYSWDWSPEMQLNPSGVKQMIRDACCIYHSKLLARLTAPKPEPTPQEKEILDVAIAIRGATNPTIQCWLDLDEETRNDYKRMAQAAIAALKGGK